MEFWGGGALTEVQPSIIIVSWCQFSHTPSITTPYFLYIFITEFDDEINGPGRYKCQGIVSTLSVIIPVLCFVVTSHQVSYIINIFD